jgi:cytochrome P450
VDKARVGLKQGKIPGRPTIFYEMLTQDVPKEELDPTRMRDEAQTIVGAGLTTTAWCLTNACYYIAENPEIQAKLHKELVEAIPDINAPDAFNYLKLESLPYLRGCVKEGIRMAIGVSGRVHRIWKTRLPYREWVIPPGTIVSMNHTDIMFDPEIFPQPMEIVPERWEGHPKAPDGSSLERYFVAFGKGDRHCLGIK